MVKIHHPPQHRRIVLIQRHRRRQRAHCGRRGVGGSGG
jgi:hypothetical protein